MSSIDHIGATPGLKDWDWPIPMSLEQNLGDLESHARDSRERAGFTYSILDGDEVIGCVYVYPPRVEGDDSNVRSWVRASRAEMDAPVWRSLSRWLTTEWPLARLNYAPRDDDQALLAMRYVAGFDATELSAATGISPGGTRTRLKRLLDRLRQDLADG